MEYKYPTTKEYLDYLCEAVFFPIQVAQDNTLISLPGQCTMQYVLSLINTRMLPYKPTDILIRFLGKDFIKKVVFISISKECLFCSFPEFLRKIIFNLNNNECLNEEYDLETNSLGIQKIIQDLTNRNILVVFIIDTLQNPKQLDPIKFNFLRDIQRLNANKIRIIYSFNIVDVDVISSELKPIIRNMVYIKPFSVEDVNYQVKRLFSKYSRNDPSSKLIDSIYEYSCGLGSLIKSMTLRSFNSPNTIIKDYSEYEAHYIHEIMLLDVYNKEEYRNKSGLSKMKRINEYINNNIKTNIQESDLKLILTKTEGKIYDYLLNKLNNLVSRDEISKCIWNDVNKYSDWAIDKHIANTRKKLPKMYRLLSIKGRGFILSLRM